MKLYEKLGINLKTYEGFERLISLSCSDFCDKAGVCLIDQEGWYKCKAKHLFTEVEDDGVAIEECCELCDYQNNGINEEPCSECRFNFVSKFKPIIKKHWGLIKNGEDVIQVWKDFEEYCKHHDCEDCSFANQRLDLSCFVKYLLAEVKE